MSYLINIKVKNKLHKRKKELSLHSKLNNKNKLIKLC